MNGHISDMKEKRNSLAGLLRKTSHCHMTKSDAMGDKYGLTVESGTKDTQLSTRASNRKYCHLEDNVAPV